ncbi:MAG: TPM domain-containing protein [Firmicutes bacterium]|nr:TPM domain-containing protein [Bacillota bacterium]
MIQKLKLVLALVITMMFMVVPVNASTNTKERTEADYLIPSGITVNDYNKDKILKTPAVNSEEKVYDFANLFTDNEETKLKDEIDTYINIHNMDLVVVTINSNNKASARDYADDFYDYNDFGIGSTRDGVLFLIDMDNREIWMSTTGNAIKMYNDYRIESSLDQVYSYMSDEEYYTGTSKYISKISDYASKGLPSNSSSVEMSRAKIILFSLLGGLILTGIIMGILIAKNRLVRKATTASEYLNKDSVDIKNLGDTLISSHTTKTKIEHDTGGGSSTHHGSSGISHGGGGHRF